MNYYSTGILDTFQPEKKVHTHPHTLSLSLKHWLETSSCFSWSIFSMLPTCFFLPLQEFQMPHDIVVSIDGVYVGDLDSRQIYKFTLESKLMCV